MKILVSKKTDTIVINCDGKKLIIKEDDELFEELKDFSKEEIRIWYKTDRFNKLLDVNN